MKITFKGKEIKVEQYEGMTTIVRKTGTGTYYILNGDEWKYCSLDRLNKLIVKHGSAQGVIDNYRVRVTGKAVEVATPARDKAVDVVVGDVHEEYVHVPIDIKHKGMMFIHPDVRGMSDAEYKAAGGWEGSVSTKVIEGK